MSENKSHKHVEFTFVFLGMYLLDGKQQKNARLKVN